MSNWRDDAACREVDPELFFPVGSGDAALAQAERAKAVCATCPVLDSCLEAAMEDSKLTGVWGGTDEAERATLRRRRRRLARQAAA